MGRHRHHDVSSHSDSDEDSRVDKREIHYKERRRHRETTGEPRRSGEEKNLSERKMESSKSRSHRKTKGSGSKRDVKKEARESRRARRESNKSERKEREESRKKQESEARKVRKEERKARNAIREAKKSERKTQKELMKQQAESREIENQERKSKKENGKLRFDFGSEIEREIEKALDFPVCIKVTHGGFWMTNTNGMHYATNDNTCDRNSVILSKDCLLYVYKLALRHLLLSMKALTPDDIDPANLVPHIKVRKNKDDPFSNHATMQHKRYVICEDQISVKNDFMIVEIDAKKDLHFTMIHSRGLGRRVDLMDCFKKVLRLLNTHPELIDKYINLEYFGAHCHDFWYEDSKDNYPLNVEAPPEYVSKRTIDTYDQLRVSAAGSIIRAG